MTLFPRIDTSVQRLQRISIVKAPNRNSLEANSALRYGASSSAYHGDHALSWRYTLAVEGSPPITRTAFPTCRAHYPADRAGARVDCFPAGQEGRHSRPAQASLTIDRYERPFFASFGKRKVQYAPLWDITLAHAFVCDRKEQAAVLFCRVEFNPPSTKHSGKGSGGAPRRFQRNSQTELVIPFDQFLVRCQPFVRIRNYSQAFSKRYLPVRSWPISSSLISIMPIACGVGYQCRFS